MCIYALDVIFIAAKSALSEMSLEDLYNLIDWIGAHHAQIRRLARHIPQAELPSFTIYNDIPRLCELYLHGPKGSSKMMHEHVQRILTQTTTKRHEAISSKEDGKVFTHAPIDIWEVSLCRATARHSYDYLPQLWAWC